MTRAELIQRLKDNNVHVWKKGFAGQEEVYVDGKIEYFEQFVESIVQECIDVLDRDASLAQIQLVADSSYGIHALGALKGGIGSIKRHFGMDK